MMTKDDLEYLKEQISIEQIESFLNEFKGEPIKKGNILISKTICHGGNSHKLYYYNNTKLFKCYTDCEESNFDVFELVLKIKKLDGFEWSLPQAVNYIVKYFGLNISFENFSQNDDELEDWKILEKYAQISNKEQEEKRVELTFFDKKILKYLPHPHILPWEEEHISRDVMEYCGICYNPSSQGIVIPHYNIDGELVGIRERTLIKENEEYGKYKPAIINGKMYNHPLGFNLYNLNNSKNNIKIFKKVVIFESEKSCLLYQSYFGIENDISVAVCGSNLTNYQIQLLLNLGVEEVIIAFDRQFKKLEDDEWKGWTKKLIEINKKISPLVQTTYIFDKYNDLGYKDAPIDRGPKIFMKMFNERMEL